MNEKMKKETPLIIAAGVIIGIIAVALVYFGNPANMGFCIACFLRDTTGALGFHSAAAVQYIRPEIVGLVLGACILSLVNKEFKPRGGSAPVTRFIIGAFVMIGCLMFLGCPFRMILRLAGGDFNALFGIIGFAAGILLGVVFLKRGYTLKRSYKMQPVEGGLFPVVWVAVLVLLVAAPVFIHFTEPEGGPGAKHAAIAISLIAGLVVGALAQKTRLCMVGGIRDAVLFREWKLLFGFLAILVAAFAGNLILGYSIRDLQVSRSHTQMDYGMRLVWLLPDSAVYFWEAARCVSLYLQAKETPIPRLRYLVLWQALPLRITLDWLPPEKGLLQTEKLLSSSDSQCWQ